MTANVLTLDGGAGEDLLSIELRAFVGEYGGTAILSGNAVLLNGGKNDDTLRLATDGITGNAVTLDGGEGQDTAVLDYSSSSTALAFDFSAAYDLILADGITLRNIERVEVSGSGSGDVFAGGGGDDFFDGSEGYDTVLFGGDRDDYRITQLESGAIEIADLRRHAPDGTDIVWNAEAFVFNEEVYV